MDRKYSLLLDSFESYKDIMPTIEKEKIEKQLAFIEKRIKDIEEHTPFALSILGDNDFIERLDFFIETHTSHRKVLKNQEEKTDFFETIERFKSLKQWIELTKGYANTRKASISFILSFMQIAYMDMASAFAEKTIKNMDMLIDGNEKNKHIIEMTNATKYLISVVDKQKKQQRKGQKKSTESKSKLKKEVYTIWKSIENIKDCKHKSAIRLLNEKYKKKHTKDIDRSDRQIENWIREFKKYPIS